MHSLWSYEMNGYCDLDPVSCRYILQKGGLSIMDNEFMLAICKDSASVRVVRN